MPKFASIWTHSPQQGSRLARLLGNWITGDLGAPRTMTDTVYLDTETTGLFGDVRIVEIAIVDDAGRALVNTLVNPRIPIPAEATSIHGIHNRDVASMPDLDDLMPHVDAAIRGKAVVIYNASYDQRLFPCRLGEALAVHCAMRRFKQLPFAVGAGNGTLARAAAWSGHQWTGVAHRALADALAARTVWQRLEEEGVPVAIARRAGGWRAG